MTTIKKAMLAGTALVGTQSLDKIIVDEFKLLLVANQAMLGGGL